MTLNSMYVLCLFARLFANPWTVARQAPLSMGFSRQEYWSGLPCPPPGGLPNPGLRTSISCASCLSTIPTEPPGKPLRYIGGGLVAQPCPALCDPMDCSLPGSSVHGIFQAGILEWVAIAFSKECSNYHTIALISHAKFFKPGFNST